MGTPWKVLHLTSISLSLMFLMVCCTVVLAGVPVCFPAHKRNYKMHLKLHKLHQSPAWHEPSPHFSAACRLLLFDKMIFHVLLTTTIESLQLAEKQCSTGHRGSLREINHVLTFAQYNFKIDGDIRRWFRIQLQGLFYSLSLIQGQQTNKWTDRQFKEYSKLF